MVGSNWILPTEQTLSKTSALAFFKLCVGFAVLLVGVIMIFVFDGSLKKDNSEKEGQKREAFDVVEDWNYEECTGQDIRIFV